MLNAWISQQMAYERRDDLLKEAQTNRLANLAKQQSHPEENQPILFRSLIEQMVTFPASYSAEHLGIHSDDAITGACG